MLHARRILFSVSLGAILCAGLGATTLEHMSLAKMAGSADLIVQAECTANSTAWDAGEIWTFTSFDIESVWKGAAGNRRVTVRLLGGKVGGLTSTVSGVPRFHPGERVVLFLERTPRGDFSIVSWMQGTFRVRRNPRTGEEFATQDTAAFATFDLATRQFQASGLRGVPLDMLRDQVAAALRAKGGNGR